MRQSEASCEGKICGDYIFKVIPVLERSYIIGEKTVTGKLH